MSKHDPPIEIAGICTYPCVECPFPVPNGWDMTTARKAAQLVIDRVPINAITRTEDLYKPAIEALQDLDFTNGYFSTVQWIAEAAHKNATGQCMAQ